MASSETEKASPRPYTIRLADITRFAEDDGIGSDARLKQMISDWCIDQFGYVPAISKRTHHGTGPYGDWLSFTYWAAFRDDSHAVFFMCRWF